MSRNSKSVEHHKHEETPEAGKHVAPNAKDEPVLEDHKPSDDLVTEGQKDDPNTPPALDKHGLADTIAAPGEAESGEKKVKVRATGDFLVYDPHTTDAVGKHGGEMRLTHFVKEKLASKKLEHM